MMLLNKSHNAPNESGLTVGHNQAGAAMFQNFTKGANLPSHPNSTSNRKSSYYSIHNTHFDSFLIGKFLILFVTEFDKQTIYLIYRTYEKLAKTHWSPDFNRCQQYLLTSVKEIELLTSHEELQECLEIYKYEESWQQSFWSSAH